MGQADFLRVGDYNAICDVCGRKFKFSRLRQKWDNTWACEQDWEPRQPQDYLKGIKDNMSVPLSRPDPPTLFLDELIVTESTVSTFSFIIARLKSLLASVSPVATILTQYYPSLGGNKVVNGSALNTNTLG
jgi:hypothetical protein